MSCTVSGLIQPEYSAGGFYLVPGGRREIHDFNADWRLFKGTVVGATDPAFDDSSWQMVNLPDGLEVLPLEASGGINYQGEAWYRKQFFIPEDLSGKRIVINFEGVMGKSKYWVNGKPVKEHFGGYLPCIIDISDCVTFGGENLVTVWADNSDDPGYPPGKPQNVLDFTYFGGVYRDVWMIATDKLHITDPNEHDEVAGGGVLIHYEEVSDASANLIIRTHIYNGLGENRNFSLKSVLRDAGGEKIADTLNPEIMLEAGKEVVVEQTLVIENPHLWHVDDPYLHKLSLHLSDSNGNPIDGVTLLTGIRSIDFRGKDGFYLNGKPFDGKLVGVNRHQDYAYVGNALPNNVHWRDAVKLRQAGVRVIRCAHYPQDPSFMDACDALGMFVIITTPGWQFWNDNPIFAERVYSDIRNMVRRDRNRPSVLLWEPILNETNYPADFAQRVHDIVHEEYPFGDCFTACDIEAKGQEHFDVVYGHTHGYEDLAEKTSENLRKHVRDYSKDDRCVFTREWGDCVADWRAQSSPSRVPKGWGERAQLIQAKHYANPDYVYTCYENLWASPKQHVGGALWHGTDHQRGYHADAFWGGILDATRQPKFSYHMFRAQVPRDASIPYIDSKPFVHIAHLIHPTSEPDVTVFSNCDEVRLVIDGEEIGCKATHPQGTAMPHLPVVFEGAFRFHRHGMKPQTFEAEGVVDGSVVASQTVSAWDRRESFVLEADTNGIPLRADGADFIPVVARIIDKRGQVVRLTDDSVRFSVVGPAEIIDAPNVAINPQMLTFGEAVVLVRALKEPGTITIRAESNWPGSGKPAPAEITIESVDC